MLLHYEGETVAGRCEGHDHRTSIIHLGLIIGQANFQAEHHNKQQFPGTRTVCLDSFRILILTLTTAIPKNAMTYDLPDALSPTLQLAACTHDMSISQFSVNLPLSHKKTILK